MATMAAEASGVPPLGGAATPPSTANPSRQTSVKAGNDPFGGAINNNTAIASTSAAAAPPTVRDIRANSLADPPPPQSSSLQQQQRNSAPQQQPPTHLQPSTLSSPATPNNSNNETISYSAERIIGNGSFGVVFQASVVESGEIVAIKKVLQDKRFKNRELQIMRQLVKDGHSNIVALKHCFYSQVRSLLCFMYIDKFWEIIIQRMT